MKKLTLNTQASSETTALAKKLARRLKRGSIVCLHGELGTGKTTFVKGMAAALKVKTDQVHSPTFTLLNMYSGDKPLYHFDLYRLNAAEEIVRIGYEEFFYGDGITVVEWADKLNGLYPEDCLKVSLEHAGENKRRITLNVCGQSDRKILEGLS